MSRRARGGPPGRPRHPHRPAPPPKVRRTDPALAALRAMVDDLAASTHAIGELMLEVAPAYLSDTEALGAFGPGRRYAG